MEVIKSNIDCLVIIEPRVFKDTRCCFFESISQREFEEKVCNSGQRIHVQLWRDERTPLSCSTIYPKQSRSLRQRGSSRCRVNNRKGSPTYGQNVAAELTEDNPRHFFMPIGLAHGFAVLSETAVFQYKCDNFYSSLAYRGISIKVSSLEIDWRIPVESALLSEIDTKHALLKDLDSPFNIFMNHYPEFE